MGSLKGNRKKENRHPPGNHLTEPLPPGSDKGSQEGRGLPTYPREAGGL
jgi:hypothetical protein